MWFYNEFIRSCCTVTPNSMNLHISKDKLKVNLKQHGEFKMNTQELAPVEMWVQELIVHRFRSILALEF